MRIISLNIWKGKLIEPLLEFLKRESQDTDIFCFQEVTSSLKEPSGKDDVFTHLAKTLPDFQGFFESFQDSDGGSQEGLALFIKKSDPVDKEGDFFVYKTRNDMVGDDWRTLGRNVQFIQFPKSGREYTVINFHGIADGEGREDSENRIQQSNKLKEFMSMIGGTKIVCGDFNLTLKTKSLEIIDEGMRNLIRENGITSTRNHHFPYPDQFCDYILVENDVKVTKFEVLQDEVSDHLALALDFE